MIGTEIMKIITEKTLGNSTPFVFVMDQWVKLLKSNLAGTTVCFSNSSRVTYAQSDSGQVIGAVVYNFDTAIRETWICLAAVDENYRGQGIYTQLFDAVCEESRAQGMKYVASNIHVNNASMLKSAEKQQRNLSYYRSKTAL